MAVASICRYHRCRQSVDTYASTTHMGPHTPELTYTYTCMHTYIVYLSINRQVPRLTAQACVFKGAFATSTDKKSSVVGLLSKAREAATAGGETPGYILPKATMNTKLIVAYFVVAVLVLFPLSAHVYVVSSYGYAFQYGCYAYSL